MTTDHSSLPAFTLVELVLTLGICSVLAGLAFSTGISSYTRGLARTDRVNASAALREARDMALHGICSQPSCVSLSAHGIHITPQSLVLFEGSTYESRYATADETIPLLGTRKAFGASDVVFDGGTASIEQDVSFSLLGTDDRLENFRINTYGAIDSDLGTTSSNSL